MSKWLPIITNEGIMYFFDKSTGKCQWTYPKIHDPKQNKYVNVFFSDWAKVKYGDKVYWLNRKSSEKQYINPWGTTYIFEACYLDNSAFVELYLEYNGDVNVIEKHGRNCLHYAVMNDNDAMTKMLIGLGCNIDHKDNKGQSALIYCINYRSYKCLKVLIEEHCDINSVDKKNNGVLHYAVKTRNHKLILFLVKNGARMEIKNMKGDYPVDVAVRDNNWPIVNLITKLSNLEKVQRELEDNNEEIFNEEVPYDLFEHKKGKAIKGFAIKNLNKLTKVNNRQRNNENDNDNDNVQLESSKIFQESSFNENRNSRNSVNKNRLSIEEINFSRDTIKNIKDNKLKVKDVKKNDSLYVIEEEYKKSKKERIKKYKTLNTSRLSTQSTLSSVTNSVASAMKDYVYPTASSLLSTGYNHLSYYLSKFVSASVQFTQVNGAIAYHYMKTFIHNVKIYFKSPPDIENQIEYLTYLEDNQEQVINGNLKPISNYENKLSKFNHIFNKTLSYLSIEELKKSSEYDQLRKSSIDITKKVNYTIKRTKRNYKNRLKRIYAINATELFDRNNKLSLVKYYNLINKLSFDKEFMKLLNQQAFIINAKAKYIKSKDFEATKPIDPLLFGHLITDNQQQQEQQLAPVYSHDIINYQISKIQTENALKVPTNSLECSLKLNFNNLKEEGGNNNNRYEIQSLSNRSYGKCYENIVKSIENINYILDNTNLQAKGKNNSMRNPIKNFNDNQDLMVLMEDEKWDDLDISNNTSFKNQKESFNEEDSNENANDIDIEDILLEYNTKLKHIKTNKSKDNEHNSNKEEDI